MQYKRKPKVLSAIRAEAIIEGYRTDPKTLPEWVQRAYETGRITGITPDGFSIQGERPTPDSFRFEVKRSDLVIMDGGGLYPTSFELFMHDYDPAPTELTFGMKLVGIDFNPSGDPKVVRLKELGAEMADIVAEYQGVTPEVGGKPTYIANTFRGQAIRDIKAAVMFAVAHITNKH